MTKDQEQIIINYLKDEEKLYQDWYQILSPQKDSTMRQVAKPPSLAELRMIGRNWSKRWFESNRSTLRDLVGNISLPPGGGGNLSTLLGDGISGGISRFCEWWKHIKGKGNGPDFCESYIVIHAITAEFVARGTFDESHAMVAVIVLVLNGLFDWICEDKDLHGLQPVLVKQD